MPIGPSGYAGRTTDYRATRKVERKLGSQARYPDRSKLPVTEVQRETLEAMRPGQWIGATELAEILGKTREATTSRLMRLKQKDLVEKDGHQYRRPE